MIYKKESIKFKSFFNLIVFSCSTFFNPVQATSVGPWNLVSTLAGNGTPGYAQGNGANAQFRSPRDLMIDQAGNLYVADSNNYLIRKIVYDQVTKQWTTSLIAGNGTPGYAEGSGVNAQFRSVEGISMAQDGD